MLSCTWTIREWQRESVDLKFSLAVCVRVLYFCFCASSGTEANPGHKESKKAVRGEPRRITKHLLDFLCLLRNVSLLFSSFYTCKSHHVLSFALPTFSRCIWKHVSSAFFHLLQSLRPSIPMPAINKRTKGLNLFYFKAIISITQTRTTPLCCRNVPIK